MQTDTMYLSNSGNFFYPITLICTKNRENDIPYLELMHHMKKVHVVSLEHFMTH